MSNPLNFLALIASLLIGLGSTTLRFLDGYRSASIAISVVGIALGFVCLRTAQARKHFVPPTAFTSQFPILFVVLGLLAVGIPEFFTDTISHWQGGAMLSFIAADSICLAALLLLVWLHIRKRPNESTVT